MSDPVSRPNASAANAIASYGPEEPLACTREDAPPTPAPVVTQEWLVDRVTTPRPLGRYMENPTVVSEPPRTNQEVARCKSIAGALAGYAASSVVAAVVKSPAASLLGGAAAKIAGDAIAAAICDPPDTQSPARAPNAPAPAPNDAAR